MKGLYNGCAMNVYCKVPGYGRLASIPQLSKKARQRLKRFDYYSSPNQNARLTCRYFGISPQTFYRWKRRYDPHHEEFYGVTDTSFNIPELNQALLKWGNVYNTIHPPRSLGYLAQQESLEHHHQNQIRE